MSATPEQSRILFARRILGLAENMMLRQMPADATAERAKEVVDAAVAFYERFDEVIQDAAKKLDTTAPGDRNEPIQPGVPPEVQ